MPVDASRDGGRIPYIGRYVVFGELGRGGMGIVYDARHPALDRQVALKVLHGALASTPQAAERLRLEAEAAARLEHENIVPIYEIGEHEGQPFLAMRLIEGESLAERLSRAGPLPPREGAALVATMARAVQHAHDRGVLHRDLKPANILLDEKGAPHLSDFGLAKCLDHDSGMTLTGTFLGTPTYASPEQAEGKTRLITTASDIYSLGAILYAVLTGHPPFSGETPSEIIEQVKHRRPAGLRILRPQVPSDLETICLKCLEKEPARRYATALSLADDLERYLHSRPILARPVSPAERLSLWVRREPAHAALWVLACLVLAALGSVPVLVYKNRAADEERRAAEQARRADEQGRSLELLQAQLLRTGLRRAGWSAEHEAHLNRAKAPRGDTNLFDNAVAALAGLDMRALAWSNAPASSVAFGGKGQILFGGLSNSPAHLWNAQLGQFENVQQPGYGPVAFDPLDAPLQFAAAGQGAFALRDLRTGEVRHEFSLAGDLTTGDNDERPILAMTLDASKVAAAVRAPARFTVWNGSGESLGTIDEYVTALCFSADGALLGVGGTNGMVTVRALPGLAVITNFSVGRFPITCLAFGRDAVSDCSPETNSHPRLLAVGDGSTAISICDLATGKIRNGPLFPSYAVLSLAFNPDGTTLAAGGIYSICLFDVESSQLLLTGPGPPIIGVGDVHALAFSPDGHRLAASGQEHWVGPCLTAWEIEQGRGVQTLPGLSAKGQNIWWSPDSRSLAALAFNWELGIWDVPNGRLTHVLRVPIGASPENSAVVFFPDGRRLAFAAGSHALVYDLEERRLLRSWELPDGYSDSLRFENETTLLHLHSEKAVAGRPNRMWALRNLFGPEPLIPIQRQQDTNWVTWETALPAGQTCFLVQGGPQDTNLVVSTVEIRQLSSAEPLWQVRSDSSYWRTSWFTDVAGRFLEYLPQTNSERWELRRLPDGQVIGWMDYGAVLSPSREHSSDREVRLHLSGADARHSVARSRDFREVGPSAFSPDSSMVAWSAEHGWVRVANLAEVQRRLKALGWTPR